MAITRTDQQEALYEIVAMAQSARDPAFILACALRKFVNTDLGEVALSIAAINAHDGLNPYADVTSEEAAAAHWAASEELKAAADDVLCANQIEALSPLCERQSVSPPMFRSVRAPQMLRAAE